MRRTRDFSIALSIVDLVAWGEDDPGAPHPALKAIFDILEIDVDIARLVDVYFNKIKIDQGYVDLYRKSNCSAEFFAIDLYRDVYDQLDIVGVYFRVEERNVSGFRDLSQSLYRSAKHPIEFHEAPSIDKVRMIAENRLKTNYHTEPMRITIVH